MARIHLVNKAQQRYATKPVLDDNGEQVRVPLTRNGEQLKDKRGNLRWQKQTVRDLDKPLPMPTCDYSACEHRTIEPGQSYRYVDLRFGTKYRHADHPTWRSWELTSAMWARVEQVQASAQDALQALGDFDDADEVKDVLSSAADEARSLAEERTEAADNMEDGFGHETEMSMQLREHADNLEAWADELEGWDPDDDAPQEDDFHYDAEGNDLEDSDEDRYNEEGTTFEDAMSEWRDATIDSAQAVLDETPDVQ